LAETFPVFEIAPPALPSQVLFPNVEALVVSEDAAQPDGVGVKVKVPQASVDMTM